MRGEPFDAAAALRWLRKLKKNNDRVWYAANSATYNESIKPTWEELVTALLISVVPIDERLRTSIRGRACFGWPAISASAKIRRRSRHPSSAWMSPFGKGGWNAGFYVRVAPGNSVFSAGIYTPEKPVLDALRRTIARDAKPFAKILAAKKLGPYLPLHTDPLIRMPRGFPADHPRGAWIRARNYLVRREFSDAEIARTGAYATFSAAIRDTAPFVRYIDGVAAAASSAAMREPSDGWDENSSSDHFGP